MIVAKIALIIIKVLVGIYCTYRGIIFLFNLSVFINNKSYGSNECFPFLYCFWWLISLSIFLLL